MKKQQQTALKV